MLKTRQKFEAEPDQLKSHVSKQSVITVTGGDTFIQTQKEKQKVH